MARVGYKELVAAARAEIDNLSTGEAMALVGDDGVVFVDVRDVRELDREGMVPGAFHAPRGMLEFWIDPESPYHREVFAKDRRFVFYCASGWRSALAAQVARRMGLDNVGHVDGGFLAWQKAGGEIVDRPRKEPKEKQ